MTYPTALAAFTTKADFTDTVIADHVNKLQDELVATQTTLGIEVLTPSYDSTAWATPPTTYTSLSNRLINIERGLINGVPTSPYLPKTGGQVSAASGSVGVIVKSATGNSADLVQTKNESNAVKFKVNSAGVPFVGTDAVVYVGSASYVALTDAISAVSAGIPAGTISPLLLSGM